MLKRKIGWMLVVTVCGFSIWAGELEDWKITSKLERLENKANDSTIVRSVIEIQNGKYRLTYRPERPAYFMDSHVLQTVDKQDYAITFWPNGARTVMYRVFKLEKEASPELVCEHISFYDQTELRLNGSTLEINVQKESNSAPKWIACRR